MSNILITDIHEDAPSVAAEFHSNSSTTFTGSNNSYAVVASSTASVESGATNDKDVAGIISSVLRGNGSDDGDLDDLYGCGVVLFHNSGASGNTEDVTGYDSLVIMQQGNIENLYDFRSERQQIGGTVENHFGVYISYDPDTPVQNWLSGNSLFGGSSFSAPNAPIDIDGDFLIIRNSKTPSSASDSGFQGQIAWDSDYMYVCVASNSWKRVALNTW